MFTPKANSKQKRTKKTQERETGSTATVQLAARTSLLAMVSYDRHNSPLARLPLASRGVTEVTHSALGKTPFCLKIPIFDSSVPKLVPKVCPNVSKHKKGLKSI